MFNTINDGQFYRIDNNILKKLYMKFVVNRIRFYAKGWVGGVYGSLACCDTTSAIYI